MPPIHLIDSTLRDGEQTPGVCFSRQKKCEIARRLDAMGISEIEAGIPVRGKSSQKDIIALRNLQLKAELSAWCRVRMEDLNAAENCGIEKIHVALPSSDRLLKTMDRNAKWLIRQTNQIIGEANLRFPYVSCGLMDASRCSLKRILRLSHHAIEEGAQRIRLADTVGIWNPAQVSIVFSTLRKEFPHLTLGFHGHNDLGLATANALAAVQAGANCVDVTVNGLGDRAGNVSIAEVVMALELSAGIPTQIDKQQLPELSRYVAKASGETIPVDKPIVGERIFKHEAGIHVKALLQDRLSFQPYFPEEVGRPKESMVAGPHSGRAALRHLKMSSPVPPSTLTALNPQGTYA